MGDNMIKTNKVIINGNLYSMGHKEYKKLMDKFNYYASERTIYALERFGVTEVVNMSYKTLQGLKKAIKRFEDENIKVYYKD